MELRLIVTTFLTIFVAELGDKTQLATLTLSGSNAGHGSKLAIFLGSSMALVATSAIGVLLGDLLARSIDPKWIKAAAGIVFLVLGALYLREAVTAGDG